MIAIRIIMNYSHNWNQFASRLSVDAFRPPKKIFPRCKRPSNYWKWFVLGRMIPGFVSLAAV